MFYHEPVLLKETIEALQVEKGRKYIDATLGDGGHTIEILKKGGQVLGIEAYQEALERAKERIKQEGLEENFIGVQGNFKNILEIAEKHGYNSVNGILYDLGLSSYELDEAELGLSFQKDEPLDMRLDKDLGVTAADLINSIPEKQLANIIYEYSGEKYAKKIAEAVIKARSVKKIQTSKQLADLIKSATPSNYEKGRIHPATRSFMALRIAVNDELENLKTSLPRAARLVLPGGVIVIITFQSLEDKIVKTYARRAQPLIETASKKPITPSAGEIEKNIRSRSAKMRVLKKKDA